MKVITHESIFILLMIILNSCANEKQAGTDNIWSNTSWQQLSSERIEIKLPNQLKKSSRYRLKEDLPILGQDTTKLNLVQESLELLEFEDAALDVYVDTSKVYRMIVICNFKRLDFNNRDVAVLKKQLRANNVSQAIANPHLDFDEIAVTFKSTTKLKIASFTTPIFNKLDESKVYNTIYYLTGDAYTLVIYEFSEDAQKVEDYLWSARVI